MRHQPNSLDTYRLLGRSGLRVSPLALGTMTFGTDWVRARTARRRSESSTPTSIAAATSSTAQTTTQTVPPSSSSASSRQTSAIA
jgi:hypothetical protein